MSKSKTVCDKENLQRRPARYVLELTLVPDRDAPEELQPPKGYEDHTRLAHVSPDPDGVLLCWEREADDG